MFVLGVNGWKKGSHDASAVLMRDGEVLCFCEEERFRRKKRALDVLPHHSIAACLQHAGLTANDIDAVAVGWNYRKRYEDRGHKWELSDEEYIDIILPKHFFGKKKKKIPVFWIDHHLAHAASAFYPSGNHEAAIIVLDGQGETTSGLVAIGKGSSITPLWDFPAIDSLGYFYESVCDYIGLDSHDAGKLMGLAAHGHANMELKVFNDNHDKGYDISLFSKEFISQGDIDERHAIMNGWINYLSKRFKLKYNTRYPIYDTVKNKFLYIPENDPYEYRDLAAIAQNHVEKCMLSIVKRVIAKTGLRNIVLAGGVALNAAANGKINSCDDINDLWIQPASGDAGVSLGAAMYVQAQQGYRIKSINTASLGIEFKNEEVFKHLTDTGVSFEEVNDPAETAAELIANGETVAWFQGRAEVGPRALGNRSLLALPSDKNMRHRINMVIKKREWWRPLAASMAEEDAEIYIKGKGPLPYMIVTAEIIHSVAEQFKSAIHEDGTTRPQTVNTENNRIYYELLMSMKKRTGHALVLDTSLNGPDEPIVSSPLDALKFFSTSRVDKMVIGNFLVKKPTPDSRDSIELEVYENFRT